MTMRATAFWTDQAHVSTGVGRAPQLNIQPEGEHRGTDMDINFRLHTTPEQALAIADKVLAGVQKWRDQIAADAERERTAADELEAARAEIARLKAVS